MKKIFSTLAGIFFLVSENSVLSQTDQVDPAIIQQLFGDRAHQEQLLWLNKSTKILLAESEMQESEMTNSSCPDINIHFILYYPDFEPASSAERDKFDYGKFPTNYISSITNEFLESLVDPDSAKFYFNGGDNDKLLGTPFNFCYRWNGELRGGRMILFYVNSKNSFGGYAGKKLFGAFLLKGEDKKYAFFQCHFDRKIIVNSKQGVMVTAYDLKKKLLQ